MGRIRTCNRHHVRAMHRHVVAAAASAGAMAAPARTKTGPIVKGAIPRGLVQRSRTRSPL